MRILVLLAVGSLLIIVCACYRSGEADVSSGKTTQRVSDNSGMPQAGVKASQSKNEITSDPTNSIENWPSLEIGAQQIGLDRESIAAFLAKLPIGTASKKALAILATRLSSSPRSESFILIDEFYSELKETNALSDLLYNQAKIDVGLIFTWLELPNSTIAANYSPEQKNAIVAKAAQGALRAEPDQSLIMIQKILTSPAFHLVAFDPEFTERLGANGDKDAIRMILTAKIPSDEAGAAALFGYGYGWFSGEGEINYLKRTLSIESIISSMPKNLDLKPLIRGSMIALAKKDLNLALKETNSLRLGSDIRRTAIETLLPTIQRHDPAAHIAWKKELEASK